MFSRNLSKISSFFLKDIVTKFKSSLHGFDNILRYVGLKEDSVSYISNILFVSLFSMIVLNFLLIFLMIKLNVLFNFLSFTITIFISFTFAFMIFLLLYKYPYYILENIKKQINQEFDKTIRHLYVLRDDNLTVHDVLNVFLNLEQNSIFSKQIKKILFLEKNNHKLKDIFKSIVDGSYSEIEKLFFRKLIEVIDGKENINNVISEFLISLEQSRKEISEQKKSRINLLFLMSIFLFLTAIIILIIILFIIKDLVLLKSILLTFAIIFSIVEFVIIFILYK